MSGTMQPNMFKQSGLPAAGHASKQNASSTPLLQRLLQRNDEAPALCQHDGDGELLRWSYGDLQVARRYCAKLMRQEGLQRGDTLLLLCTDVPPFFAVFLAALELELCLLPLHPDQDKQSLQDIVREQQPVLVIVDVHAREVLEFLRHQVARCYLLEAGSPDWLQRMHPLPSAPGSRDAGKQQAHMALPAMAQCAVVFHSSGSTGRPKAIHYSRAQLDSFLFWQQRLFEPFDDEAQGYQGNYPTPRINVLPLAHWGGLSFCLQALAEGRTVYLCNVFRVNSLLQLIEATGCRLLMLVPAMYRAMLQRLEQTCPPSLQYCLTMGEAMPMGLAQKLRKRHGLLLCAAYGMSEALSGLAHGAVPWEDMPCGSCGQHAFGELRLVAPSGEVQAESGVAEGELWVRNATTQPRYTDADLLQAKYVDGWYRSGDCFHRDAAGHYHFLARLDAMCVHNGRNVYPQQVEAVFIEHPAIEACVAAPLRLRDGRRRLAVYLVPVAGLEPDAEELLDFYLAHGAHYAAPVFLLQADSLPATVSGKPERSVIAALLQEAYDCTTFAEQDADGQEQH